MNIDVIEAIALVHIDKKTKAQQSCIIHPGRYQLIRDSNPIDKNDEDWYFLAGSENSIGAKKEFWKELFVRGVVQAPSSYFYLEDMNFSSEGK